MCVPVLEGAPVKHSVTYLSTLIAVLAFNACGVTATAPTPLAAGSTAEQLVGVVTNSIAGPLSDVQVSVIGGTSSGAMTQTGHDGYFRVPFNFRSPGELRFAKDGYAPLTVVPTAQPSGAIAISLHLAVPPLRMAGTYTVTFTAGSECTQIPDTLRSRSYTASVDQPAQFPQNTRFEVSLTGAAFANGTLRVSLSSFYGFVEGSTVQFRVANLWESLEIDEGIAEQIAPGVRLEIFGAATQSVADPDHMAMPMTGYFALTDGSGTRSCASPNHLVRWSRLS